MLFSLAAVESTLRYLTKLNVSHIFEIANQFFEYANFGTCRILGISVDRKSTAATFRKLSFHCDKVILERTERTGGEFLATGVNGNFSFDGRPIVRARDFPAGAGRPDYIKIQRANGRGNRTCWCSRKLI